MCGRWASACWGGSLHGHIQGWPLRARDARAVCPLLAQVMFSRRSRPCPEAGLHVSCSALSLFVGLLGPDRKLTRSVCDLLRGPRQAGSVTHIRVEPCGLGTESWGSPPVSEHPRVDASGARLALCVRPWPPADAAARLERTPVAWSTWRVGQCLGTCSPFVSPQLAARLSREETQKDPREASPPPSPRVPGGFVWFSCGNLVTMGSGRGPHRERAAEGVVRKVPDPQPLRVVSPALGCRSCADDFTGLPGPAGQRGARPKASPVSRSPLGCS